jgi:copper chaperone CopZ
MAAPPGQRVRFVVEEAGCSSCAERVRGALEPLGAIDRIEVDEQADSATVRLAADRAITEHDVARALAEAAAGSGHEYRVRVGTWTPIA